MYINFANKILKIIDSKVKQLSSQLRMLVGGFERWWPLPISKVTRFFHDQCWAKL